MPFDPTVSPRKFSPSPVPVLDQDQRKHLERELGNVRSSIDALSDAVTEIQEYLKSQP